jgi:uncharacterized membrane protein
MDNASEIKEELNRQHESLKRWLSIQSVLRWIFIVNLLLTMFFIYTNRQKSMLSSMWMVTIITFLALVVTFITTGLAATKIRKLIRQLESLPAENGEAPSIIDIPPSDEV